MRHVEAPDGTRWIVERHWLARRPRYIGFRFGVKRRQQEWEQPLTTGGKLPEIHRSSPRAVPGPKVYRDSRDIVRAERARRRRSDGGGWVEWWPWSWGGGSGSAGRSGGGMPGGGGSASGGSTGGGARGSSGGGTRGLSSGGGGRGGGGGGDADWDDVLGWILVAIVVVVVAVVVVFVVIPAVLFLAGYLLFWLLVGGWLAYNTLTSRPWVVKATKDGYEEPDYAYRVKGWRNSQALIDDIAGDLRRGEPPTPSEVAVEVELIED